MKTAKRLEQALIKLYNSFHNDELNPECCTACAVGNILDNFDSWKHLSNSHGSLELSYVGRVHENLGRKFNGYSPLELLQTEKIFLEACGFKTPLCHYNPKPKNPTNKETLFNGLCAVVAYLCALDNIPNVMDYSKIFEYEESNPVYKFEVIYS
ncbi:Na(+)-translocating NADH-quinone reductase subunit F [Tenacibaculum aquimarinum]|uniref:Na(+)-translocating NADH-quinone reductase subunit F n=1 Tax=Tenacibaculum aquimarinum TaxID=2910675 RepID=UPI001F0B3BD8|nr:Na(+)-translocating NADH-quinone reductase subunit F [Tenacibaculum aquimarinum]MCH3881059.1 Na(+)-translocating NADH-quinone reductase subunit F [Tenacibaculum aquimarinum]